MKQEEQEEENGNTRLGVFSQRSRPFHLCWSFACLNQLSFYLVAREFSRFPRVHCVLLLAIYSLINFL